MTKCPTCGVEATEVNNGFWYPLEWQIDDDRAHAKFERERVKEYELYKAKKAILKRILTKIINKE